MQSFGLRDAAALLPHPPFLEALKSNRFEMKASSWLAVPGPPVPTAHLYQCLLKVVITNSVRAFLVTPSLWEGSSRLGSLCWHTKTHSRHTGRLHTRHLMVLLRHARLSSG